MKEFERAFEEIFANRVAGRRLTDGQKLVAKHLAFHGFEEARSTFSGTIALEKNESRVVVGMARTYVRRIGSETEGRGFETRQVEEIVQAARMIAGAEG